jgi:ankyrin repeat protein
LWGVLFFLSLKLCKYSGHIWVDIGRGVRLNKGQIKGFNSKKEGELKKSLIILLLAILVVTFLMAMSQKANDFFEPIFFGKIDKVKKLIEAGVDVNEKFNWGANRDITALVMAVMFAKVEICKVLIDAGADVNIITTGKMTLLHHAAMSSGDYKDVAELLIAKGLDVNAKTTEYGEARDATPLHLAVGMGNINIADVLIKNGAELDAKFSDHQHTPLHLAAREGHKAVVELLIAKGADVNAKMKNGDTPLDLAILKEHKELADLLRKHGGISGKK